MAFELVLIFDSKVQRILPCHEPIATALNNNHTSTLFAFELNPKAIRQKYREEGALGSSNEKNEIEHLGKRLSSNANVSNFSINGYSSNESGSSSDENKRRYSLPVIPPF